MTGPRPRDLPANLDLGGMLTQAALQMLLRATLGNDAPDTAHLREVKNGSPNLLRHYLVFATDEAPAGRLLTSQVERALLALS